MKNRYNWWNIATCKQSYSIPPKTHSKYKGQPTPSEPRARTGYWLYNWENLRFSTIFGPFLGLLYASVTHKGFKMIIVSWWSTHVILHLVKKPLVLPRNNPKRLYGLENLPFSTLFGPFWGLFNASVTHIGFKDVPIYQNNRWNVSVNLHYLQSGKKTLVFGQKQPQNKKIKKKQEKRKFSRNFFKKSQM